MKPDGVAMDTVEPTDATVEAEPSSSEVGATHEEVIQQDPSLSKEESASKQEPDSTGAPASKKANGNPTAAAVSKAKSTGVSSKKQTAPTTGTTKTTGPHRPKPRPGSSTSHTVNGVKPSTNDLNKNTTLKKATPTAGTSASGAVPKKPAGAAAASTVKTQTKVLDRKPVGTARTANVPAAPLPGSRPMSGSGISNKKLPASPSNAAKSKLTGPTSKAAAATAPKPSAPTATKAVPKTTRPAAVIPTSRLASSTTVSKSSTTRAEIATATVKPTTSRPTSTRPAFSKAPAAPPTSRTAAVQAPKNTTVAKKDGTKPSSTTAPKKPTVSATATKKPEVSKPAVNTRPDAASKRPSLTKAAQPKTSQPKTQDPSKRSPIKKAAAPITQHPSTNKQTLGKAPHSLPASKPHGNSTFQAEKRPKPIQSVQPFSATKTKQISNSRITSPEAAPATAMATVAAETITDVSTVTQAEAEVALPEMPSDVAAILEDVTTVSLAEDTTAEVVPLVDLETPALLSPSQSPVRAPVSPPSPSQGVPEDATLLVGAQEQTPAQTEDGVQIVASSPEQAPTEEPVCLVLEEILPTSTAPSLIAVDTSHVASSNLNEEDEDEEEREGSQQVSISDMSGTTQPTEESRPGSAGPAGPWRSGGALLSELDSEEVSCSQQGASELSAPGVLEGTESMDDLGDGSLKGASAGSPDFERVPDIPANDFDDDEDDEDDDDDRVCDMDVCSERAEDPQRARHDNEVDEEEEDEDVEMASEGVTESGLESYGNADEDDFAEDERLDNLNRAAHELPPPPPLLPSAPAAQWDQPNPFADPWAHPSSPQLQDEEPLRDPSQPIQPVVVSQPIQPSLASPASPSIDPWQADSETPTQSPAEAWLELGSAPFIPQTEEESDHLSIPVEPLKQEPQIDMDIGSPAPMDNFINVPGTPPVPSMSPNPEPQPEMNISSPVPMQNLSPALEPVLGISQSSTMSSETSTPDEVCDYNQEVELDSEVTQVANLILQPDSKDQDLSIPMEHGEKEGDENDEAETPAADEVLGGPAAVPALNPSEPQPETNICSPAPTQNLSPAFIPVLGISKSSTVSSETSMPDEVCDYNQEVELDSEVTQAANLSLQLDSEDQDLSIKMERIDKEGDENYEAETLPADEALSGPATAPTSNLSEPQPEMNICSPVTIQNLSPALAPVLGISESSTMSSETSCTEEVCDDNQKVELESQATQAAVLCLQPETEEQDLGIHMERGDREGDEDEEAETLPADEVLGGPATAPTSNPSSSSATEDEASDTEGEAQLEDPLNRRSSRNGDLDNQSPALHSLSALEEQEEAGLEDECEGGTREDATPPSANSAASYGFDTMTTASNSNAQSTGESCTKSPGIFSLEELPEEIKDPCLIQDLSQDSQSLPSPPESNPAEQQYMQCGQQGTELGKDTGEGTEASDPPLQPPSPQEHPEDTPTDTQPPYYSAICEKTENSLTGNV